MDIRRPRARIDKHFRSGGFGSDGTTLYVGVDRFNDPYVYSYVFATKLPVGDTLLTLSPSFSADTYAYTTQITDTSITQIRFADVSNYTTISSGDNIYLQSAASDGGKTTYRVNVFSGAGTPTVPTVNTMTDDPLATLTVSPGTLSPAFAAGTHGYRIEVPGGTESVTIAATTTVQNGTVSGTGVKTLTNGAGLFDVAVTNGDFTRAYRIAVYAASAQADVVFPDVASFALSTGVLYPTFADGTYSYGALYPSATGDLTITLTGEGETVDTITGAGDKSLSTGTNRFVLAVSNADMRIQYALLATRSYAPVSPAPVLKDVPPQEVRSFNLTGVTNTTATLTWTKPNQTVSRYEYRLRKEDGRWGDWKVNSGTTLSLTGLDEYTFYSVQVRAVNTYGNGVAQAATFRTLAGSVSVGINIVKTGTITTNSIPISWELDANAASAGGPDSYDTRYRKVGGTWSAWVNQLSSVGMTKTFSSLNTASEHEMQVVAIKGSQRGVARTIKASTLHSSALVPPPRIPSAQVTAVRETSGVFSFDVKWEAAFGDPIRYEYRHYVPDTWSAWTSNGTARTKTFTNVGSLLGGRYIQIRAVNDQGESPPLTLFLNTRGLARTQHQTPHIPQAVTIDAKSNRSFTIDWTNDVSALEYVVERWQGVFAQTIGDDPNVTQSTGTESSYTATGLEGYTAYQVDIRGENAHGDGYRANVALSTKPDNQWAGGPSDITPLSVGSITATDDATSMTFSWTAVSGALRYEYRVDGGEWLENGTLTNVVYTGASLGDLVEFQVRVVTASKGYGAESSIAVLLSGDTPGATDAPSPPAPVEPADTLPVQVSNKRVSNITNTAFRVLWDTATRATSYEYRHRETIGGTWGAWQATTNARADISGLTQATIYMVQVRSKNNDGESIENAISNTTTGTSLIAPAQVQSLTVSAISDNAAGVSWSAPATGTVTRYLIRYRRTAGVAWSAYFTTTATSFSLTGLIPGNSYQVQVLAANGSAEGPAVSSTFSTTGSAPSAPGAVSTITTTNRENTSLTISWGAVATATRYEVRYKRFDEESWSSWARQVAAKLTFTATGLIQGSTYQFQVRALNSAGTGVATAHTAATSGTAPSPVAITSESDQTDYDVEFTITPDDLGNDDPNQDRFQHRIILLPGTLLPAWQTLAAGVRTVNYENLQDGRTYRFEARSYRSSDAAVGVPSQQTLSVVWIVKKPTGVSVALETDPVDPTDHDTVVSWTNPAPSNGISITRYVLKWRTDSVSESTYAFSQSATSKALPASITSQFTSGETLTVSIAAGTQNATPVNFSDEATYTIP